MENSPLNFPSSIQHQILFKDFLMKGFCDKSNWSCQDPAASSAWKESQVCCGGGVEMRRAQRILQGLHFNPDKVRGVFIIYK